MSDWRISESMQRFEAGHGRAAAVMATIFVGVPFAACALAGLFVGMILGFAIAVPGAVLTMIAAVPHWVRSWDPPP